MDEPLLDDDARLLYKLIEERGLVPIFSGDWAHDAAAAAQTCRRLYSFLRSDPLIDQWLAFVNTQLENDRVINSPLLSLAEQRAWAMRVVSPLPITMATNDQPADVQRIMTALDLSIARTYLWTDFVADTLLSYPMPPHIIDRDVLPFVCSFHTFETPFVKTGTTDQFCHWELLVAKIGGFQLKRPLLTSDAPPRITGSHIAYGMRYPDDFAESARSVGELLGRCGFLKSPFIEVTEHRLPRQLRRHGGVGSHDLARTISVVTLRQAARQAMAAYDGESRTFRHRWWVRAHWRRQWHPSRRAHELKWIAPYLKGKPDAPMIPTVYKVGR